MGPDSPLIARRVQFWCPIAFSTSSATVLVHTHLAGPNGIRMKDLAKNASLSTSGLTALVDRLERQGLVQRNRDPHDRRATRITLTDDGLERARQATHVHIASIEHHFASRLTESDATALAGTLERIEQDASSATRSAETSRTVRSPLRRDVLGAGRVTRRAAPKEYDDRRMLQSRAVSILINAGGRRRSAPGPTLMMFDRTILEQQPHHTSPHLT